MPDKFAIETLLAARRRGVDIEIIVPGPHMDEKMLKKASQSIWGILLDAGIKIYEYQPTMYHCKTIIVDDLWMSVGSTNFDSRSFLLNDEANLNIYDANFAKEQIKVFEEDKQKSILVTRANFKERSNIGKIFNVLASLVRGQI
jgi:cardiolipin synthase